VTASGIPPRRRIQLPIVDHLGAAKPTRSRPSGQRLHRTRVAQRLGLAGRQRVHRHTEVSDQEVTVGCPATKPATTALAAVSFSEEKTSGPWRFRTSDPYRVKVVLYR
jgi:hypothetical protein